MTEAQIKYVLDTIDGVEDDKSGYEVNNLIPLTEIGVIVCEGNYNVYPDDNMWVKFCTEKDANLLLGYRGTTDIAGEFTPKSLPCIAIPFSQIISIQMASASRPKAAYRFGRSM